MFPLLKIAQADSSSQLQQAEETTQGVNLLCKLINPPPVPIPGQSTAKLVATSPALQQTGQAGHDLGFFTDKEVILSCNTISSC